MRFLLEQPEHYWKHDTAVELIAAIAIDPRKEPLFSLLWGVHPEAHENLPDSFELHEVYPYLRYCRREDLASIPSVSLWMRHVPGLLDAPMHDEEVLCQHLWLKALEDAQVLRLGYSFRPRSDIELAQLVERDLRQAQMGLANDGRIHSEAGERILWTSSFPGGGVPAQYIEAQAGFHSRLKQQLKLDGVEPGLLFNYLHARNEAVENLLDSRRFEEFVATLFREEGWSVNVTPATRDGGKDIVAERTDGDAPELVYVQAKRYRKDRAVGIYKVKEFAATLAGDAVKRGVLVTTSHVSPDGKAWAITKGAKLALVEFMERMDLIERLRSLSVRNPGVFLLP